MKLKDLISDTLNIKKHVLGDILAVYHILVVATFIIPELTDS